MPKPVSIIEAIEDKRLFGDWLGPLDTWTAWLAILKGAYAEPMTEAELAIFTRLTKRAPPDHPVRELWVCAGRRSGKSTVVSMIAVYYAALRDYSAVLRRGEIATIPIVAADRAQARTVFRYVRSLLAGPMFVDLVVAETKDTITLNNDVAIEVGTASTRSLRGYSVPCAICDEVAYWKIEGSTEPDIEILASLRPAQVTFPEPLLVGISTPYSRRGALWETYRDHFGRDGSDILVVQAETRDLNSTVGQAEIDEAMKRDPAHAEAEYGAKFRTDIQAFLDDAMIDGAIDHNRPLELPPRDDLSYVGFVDASGGRHDSYTIAVGHREDDKVVIDLVRGQKAPLDPASVTENYAMLSKLYGLASVEGDRYSGEWVVEAFRKHGIEYRSTKKSKSELYLESLPNFAQRRLRMPNHKALIRELRLLERRTHRSGRDSVDHGPAGADDHANSVAGVMWCLRSRPERQIRIRSWGDAEPAHSGISEYQGGGSFGDWARNG